MWGNIFSGVMSLAQGDSPEEMLKKQAMATVMGGTAPVGVESASNSMMSTLAEQGVADAGVSHLGSQLGGELTNNMVTQNPALTNGLGQSSNMLTQFGRDAGGFVSDTFGGMGDTISEFGSDVNDFTGMEARDWTQLGIQGGVGALSAPPPPRPQPAPMGQGISKPQGNPASKPPSLLSSNPTASQAGGQQLTPEQIMKLKQQGII